MAKFDKSNVTASTLGNNNPIDIHRQNMLYHDFLETTCKILHQVSYRNHRANVHISKYLQLGAQQGIRSIDFG